LPDAVRGKMEAALRSDFSGVRVHVGPQAQRIGAIAFTVGSDIYFAPGRYQPDTIEGQQLLGHELAHVVQQRANRVRNPLNTELAVVQNHSLEAEADRLGRHAATFRAHGRSAAGNAIMQRSAAMWGLASHPGRPSRGSHRSVVQRMDMELTDFSETGGREGKIVTLMGEEIADEKMRADVISVCHKVQIWAQSNDADAIVRETGRDLIFYNKWAYARPWATEERSAEYQLVHWNADAEPTGDTVAMLMDFALAWKHTKVEQKNQLELYAEDYARRRTEWRQTEQYREEKGLEAPLSTEELERKEANSKRLVTLAHGDAQPIKGQKDIKGFNPNSDLYRLKEQKDYQINAGPSSSTASLLWFLRRVGNVTQTEAKSVTRALATKYWGEGSKNLSRQYHTQFEATIPLARHLSKFST
jgi:Domain of unknown function (DUF4157)